MTGRLIALEGPDGVGKSTIAAQLADLTYNQAVGMLDPHPAVNGGCGHPAPMVLVPRRQITATHPYAAGLMQHLSTMLWHSGDDRCLSDAFWVSLQAAWGTAHTETVLTPLLDAGFDVLLDGWFYKFLAKLLVQGWAEHDVERVFARVRTPDAVILLTGDLGAIFDSRAAQFRPAELGMHAGYPELNRATFLRYQQAALDHLIGFADRDGWQRVTRGPDDALHTTVGAVRAALHTVRGSALAQSQ